MVGPCWTSPLPRIRLEPDAVKPGSQLDLFRQLRPVEANPPASGPPAPNPGAARMPPSPEPARTPPGAIAADDVVLEAGTIRVWYVPHERARRYRLMLRPDGTARCTVPRRGSLRDARRFVEGARGWLAQQWQRRASRPKPDPHWKPGTPVWFRGTQTPLIITWATDGRPSHLQLGEVTLPFRPSPQGRPAVAAVDLEADLRPAVERALRRLAELELPLRVQALAAPIGIAVTRITVRNQQTRWGSCSRHGVVSLNWRLIQTPDFVRDYIILHELAHRRHLNHSAHFWDEVARLCPEWEIAEAWIKRHGRDLL